MFSPIPASSSTALTVKHAVLGHLSNENNTPELALVTVKAVLDEAGIGENMYVTVADRYHPSGVFEL